MVATPKNCVFRLRGKSSGRSYSVSGYVSDVANAKVTFNTQGLAGATDDNYWILPEDCTLEDYSMTTGTADTKGIVALINGNPVANMFLDYVAHVSTNADRPKINRSFPQGMQLGFKQVA